MKVKKLLQTGRFDAAIGESDVLTCISEQAVVSFVGLPGESRQFPLGEDIPVEGL